jgi:hypothetical protein
MDRRYLTFSAMLAIVVCLISISVSDLSSDERCPKGAATQGIRHQRICGHALNFWTAGFT